MATAVLEDNAWLCKAGALAGSLCVGLSGLLPILLIPLQIETRQGTSRLRLLLSFAVGSLLGDVFLHLLPESYTQASQGLWVLAGLLAFLIIEKVFEATDIQEGKEEHNNNKESIGKEGGKKVVGYLNLVANCVDNFVHGLAVASSFLTSLKLGLITTFAILIHEIPHEIGDFAILLKSGFSRREACKAQLVTATLGLFGAYSAVWSLETATSLSASTCWVLPFTAGGFLNIALVSVLPELMEEDDPREAMKQLGSLLLGITVMGLLSLL